MKVLVSDLAHWGLDQIENWYFEPGEHLQDLFYNEFEELLIFIGIHPNSGFILKDGYRIYHLNQFPHLVICEIQSDVIEVVHVFHPKQHPNLRFKRIK